MTTQNEFMNALRLIKNRSERIPLPDVLVLKVWEHVSESTSTTEHTPEIEERATSLSQSYLVPYPNEVANPDFDADLTSWTEDIDAGITATTKHTAVQGEAFAEQGAIGGLEVEVTASSGTGQASRKQTGIVSGASEVWNFQAWVNGISYTNAEAQLRIIWSGGATAEVASTDVSGDWVELKLENQTSPGGTTSVDVYVEIDVTTNGGIGKVFIGKVRAERAAASTISSRARRIIVGEWKILGSKPSTAPEHAWMQPTSQPVLPVLVPQTPPPVPSPGVYVAPLSL